MAGFTLITGASSGIGEKFARAFAARRENLILVARSRDKLLALAEELGRAHGVAVEVFPADLSTPAAADALAQALGERHLEVETLVNNAGFGARGRFWELPLDRQREMFQLNVMAVVELTHRLLEPMIAKRRGAVINVSSTAAYPSVTLTCYQNGVWVTNQTVGFYPGWAWSQVFPLSSWKWTGGAADCDAVLFYQTSKGQQTLATMSFHVYS